MKILATLTPDETRNLTQNIEFKDLNDIPYYNKETDSYEANGIEYPTEDELYESLDDMEM